MSQDGWGHRGPLWIGFLQVVRWERRLWEIAGFRDGYAGYPQRDDVPERMRVVYGRGHTNGQEYRLKKERVGSCK